MLVLPSLLLCGLLTGSDPEKECFRSYLYQPAYCIDEVLRGPAEPYVPQPGDIFLSTDRSFIIRMGHCLATSGAPHHSGLVVAKCDGTIGILESGPFNCLHVEIVDFQQDLDKHLQRGEKVWIRKRRTPLTPEQCAELTAWAERQNGKRFAAGRMMLQLTPLRCRGPLRTYFIGQPRGEHNSYFCSELVQESCVHVGLLSPETTRPTSAFPRDLFFDKSTCLYVSRHFSLAQDWYPPARWTNCPDLVSVKARVEIKAVDRKTGEVLAVDRQTALVVDPSEQLAGKAALQEAAAQLAERILPRLVKE